ncbi:MAG: hypothetical protein ABIG63_15510 [Chloroflexota bacterium]
MESITFSWGKSEFTNDEASYGALVLAMTKLEQAVRCHRPIATGCGTIQPDLFRMEVIHPQQMAIQVILKTGRFLLQITTQEGFYFR